MAVNLLNWELTTIYTKIGRYQGTPSEHYSEFKAGYRLKREISNLRKEIQKKYRFHQTILGESRLLKMSMI